MTYIPVNKANTNHKSRDENGREIARYSRYETGIVAGKNREVLAVIADKAGFDGMGFDASIGSGEAETFYAGALPAGYMTQKTDDEMDMTFIETLNGDIFKSYRACHKLIFNADGTVNEPQKYAFKVTIALIHNKKNNHIAPVARSWIVCVKSGRTEVSSAGRSEIIKETISFQKLRPSMFEH